MKKRTFIIILPIIIVSALWFLNKNSQEKSLEINLKSKKIEPLNDSISHEKDTVSIIGVGDIMLGTNYPSADYLPPNDGKDLLAPVKNILADATVTFGNLEGTLLTGNGTVKKCKNPNVCYAFKSPEHYADYIKDAGFDVVSIANNHVGDFGEIGRKNTVEILKSKEIAFAGLEEYPFATFEKDGIKFGFCAFAPNNGTIKITDYENAKKIVQHLDSICDIVIVSFHGGAEGSNYQHITRKNELFLGENRGNPYEFARVVIDAGADVVFGHGPHLTRAMDLYKDRFIAYSLGNFATYKQFNLKGSLGVAPIVKVFTDKNGKFLEAKITAIKQEGEGGPILDETGTAIREIQNLTKTDVPETDLTISDEGIVRKIK
ncbi:MAG: CapA family protein [Flavobacteriaceae bacterium]|jgi:poly-gamma-glutamate capsule biosynthesis protein CapA/YwtB (metallophosphatase superfamily)|nr:CapA family protein [Flavobacteriaceae bacterium]